jgi:DNA-binding HxlR family transcriptional regulator
VRAADLIHEPCSIARPIAFLGDRWTLIVLRQAFLGTRRFADFHAALGLSRSVLTDRLNGLVEAGVLRRKPYRDSIRTRDEYRLTEKGIDLYPVLRALAAWGDRYLAEDGPFALYRHKGCGGESELVHRCAACDATLTAREVQVLPGPGTSEAAGPAEAEPAA